MKKKIIIFITIILVLGLTTYSIARTDKVSPIELKEVTLGDRTETVGIEDYTPIDENSPTTQPLPPTQGETLVDDEGNPINNVYNETLIREKQTIYKNAKEEYIGKAVTAFDTKKKEIAEKVLNKVKQKASSRGISFTDQQLERIRSGVYNGYISNSELENILTKRVEETKFADTVNNIQDFKDKIPTAVEQIVEPIYEQIDNLDNDKDIQEIADSSDSDISYYSSRISDVRTNKDYTSSQKSRAITSLINSLADALSSTLKNAANQIRSNQYFIYATSHDTSGVDKAIEAVFEDTSEMVDIFLDEKVNDQLEDKIGKVNFYWGNYLEDNMVDWLNEKIYEIYENFRDVCIKEINKQSDFSADSKDTIINAIEEDIFNEIEKARADVEKSVIDWLTKERVSLNCKFEPLKYTEYSKIEEQMDKMSEQYADGLLEILNETAGKFEKNFSDEAGINLVNGLLEFIRDKIASGEGVSDAVNDYDLSGDFSGLPDESLANDMEESDIYKDLLKSIGMSLIVNALGLPLNFEMYNEMNSVFAGDGPANIIPPKFGMSAFLLSNAYTPIGIAPWQYSFIPFDDFDSTLFTLCGVFDTSFGFPGFSTVGPKWPLLLEPLSVTMAKYKSTISIGAMRVIGSRSELLAISVPQNVKDAYVLTFMGDNDGAASAVQMAFSIPSPTSLLRPLYIGTPIISITQLEDGYELYREGLEFEKFTMENWFKGGFKNTIKDETKSEKLVSKYDRDEKKYILGPFEVDYNRSCWNEGGRGQTEFGKMVNMDVFDQDGKVIDKSHWTIVWQANGKENREDRMRNDPYPQPHEEFYIKLDNYLGNQIQEISKIELSYKEMQVIVATDRLTGEYKVLPIFETIVPIPHTPTAHHNIFAGEAFPMPATSLISVNVAKKYYVNYKQTIYLERTDKHGGYEDATFTTTSSTSKSGMTNIQTSYGSAANAALFASLQSLLGKIGTNVPGTALSRNSMDAILNMQNIFTEGIGKTPLLDSVTGILKGLAALDQNGLIKLPGSIGKLTKYAQLGSAIGILNGTGGQVSWGNVFRSTQDMGSGNIWDTINAITGLAREFGVDSEYLDIINGVSKGLSKDSIDIYTVGGGIFGGQNYGNISWESIRSLNIVDWLNIAGSVFGDKIKVGKNGSINFSDIATVFTNGKITTEDIIKIGGNLLGGINIGRDGHIGIGDIMDIARKRRTRCKRYNNSRRRNFWR